jgi:hypothetical protein
MEELVAKGSFHNIFTVLWLILPETIGVQKHHHRLAATTLTPQFFGTRYSKTCHPFFYKRQVFIIMIKGTGSSNTFFISDILKL